MKFSYSTSILLVVFLFTGQITFGQHSLEEIKGRYMKAPSKFPDRMEVSSQYIRALFFNDQIEPSFQILDENIRLAEKQSDGKYAAYFYCVKAMNYRLLDEVDLADNSLKKAKFYATKTTDPEMKGYVHYCEGWLNVRNSKESEAVHHYITAVKYYQQTSAHSKTKLPRLSSTYKELVSLYSKWNEHELQEKYSFLTLQTAIQQNDPKTILEAYMAIGYMYEQKYDAKKDIKLRDAAEKYYLLAINTYQKHKVLQNDPSSLSFVSNNLANLYFYYYPKSQHAVAKQYALLANETAIRIGRSDHIASSSGILAELALEKEDYDGAKTILLNALTSVEKFSASDLSITLSIYETLGKISEKQGEFSDALKYSKLYNDIYRKIYDQDKLELAKRLESQYGKELQQEQLYRLKLEAEQKEQSIQLMTAKSNQQKKDLENLKLSEENQRRQLEYAELESSKRAQALKLSELESKKKSQDLKSFIKELKLKEKINNYYIITIVTILLFVGLIFYTFWQRVRNMKQKVKLYNLELEQEKQNSKISTLTALLKGEEDERTRIARDLHDGLGGLLSGTKIQLSELDKKMDGSSKKDLSKSINQLDSAVDELRRVAHNLMPDLLIKYGLKEALIEYAARMSHENLDIDVQFLSYTDCMDQETQLLVYRIIQELVNNSVKHASPSQIIIQLVEDASGYMLTVEDDGIGFEPNQQKLNQSAGFHNIQSRVQFLKGTINIQSSINLGTSIEISFPKN